MSLVKLKSVILPEVFAGKGLRFVDCELDSSSIGQDQFMSNVVFLTACVQNDQGTVKLPLVVKFEPFNAQLRQYINTNIQFYNEVLMYEKVLPFLNRSNICEDIFAKFYHGVGKLGKPDESIIILEDLRPYGYRLTKERVCLDLEHLTLALAKLGRFHALSYAAKHQNPNEFYKLAQKLQEPSWIEEIGYHHIIRACFRRPLDHLVKQKKHAVVLSRLAEKFDQDVVGFVKKLVFPGDPLAVICHGDFNRNNILFKYSQDGQRATDVKFFDVATARCASPVVDISFFLFLNSSRETRLLHWDHLLESYHSALSSALPDTPVPSLHELQREMRLKALYGFVHCSFFLPAMKYDNPYTDLEMVMNAPQDQVAEDYARLGGEDGTRLLADMVEELVDRGCITMEHEFML